jgi:hypothetical protein
LSGSNYNRPNKRGTCQKTLDERCNQAPAETITYAEATDLGERTIKTHKTVVTMDNESLETLIFTNIHFAVDVKLKTDN